MDFRVRFRSKAGLQDDGGPLWLQAPSRQHRLRMLMFCLRLFRWLAILEPRTLAAQDPGDRKDYAARALAPLVLLLVSSLRDPATIMLSQ